jgi:hypothetical protein
MSMASGMKRSYSQRLSGVDSAMPTCTRVSMVDQARGEVKYTVGAISRRSRCTVSCFSGMLTENCSASAAATVKMKSPTQAIGM